MMNKLKSAKLHLVKFLFLLPLLAVLLLAFRLTTNTEEDNSQNQRVTISGLIVETGNYKLLSNVHFKEVHSQVEGNTDERGYYTFILPISAYPQKLKVVFTKEGYKNKELISEISNDKNRTERSFADIIGMVPGKNDGNLEGSFVHGVLLPDKTGRQSNYELVAKAFENMKQFNEAIALLEKQSAGSDKPYWIINGHTFLLNAGGGTASVETITDIVIVDGKRMTGKEVNEKITRSMVRTAGAMDKVVAQKKYGIDQDVMEIYTTDQQNIDTLLGKPAR